MENRDHKEFMELVEKEKDFLRAHAYNMTRKAEDAEDLFQETVFKGFKGWGGFQKGTNFKAWMGRIMLNTHINNVNRKRDSIPCDFSVGECDNIVFNTTDDTDVSHTANPEKIFFSNHIDNRLEELIFSLPDTFRMPFTLYHFEGYMYEDISKMLGLPIGTIKSRIFRARKMLKDSYSRTKG
ncbi:MAG TPA: sigma-70 family RNA polymerase sigma factor [bacterium]|nr:sigma-70 family RNA polymerase sigma factor [bacterium]